MCIVNEVVDPCYFALKEGNTNIPEKKRKLHGWCKQCLCWIHHFWIVRIQLSPRAEGIQFMWLRRTMSIETPPIGLKVWNDHTRRWCSRLFCWVMLQLGSQVCSCAIQQVNLINILRALLEPRLSRSWWVFPCMTRRVVTRNGHCIRLDIWDTAGQVCNTWDRMTA